MNKGIFLILFVTIFSCSKIKILDEPCTKINIKPLQIETTEYAKLRQLFHLEDLINVPKIYGGLKPQYPLAFVTKSLKESITDTTIKEHLWMSHGLILQYYDLLLVKNGKTELINSKEKFDKYFIPIEDEEEALAYVSIITETDCKYDFDINFRYRTYVKELNKSYASKVKNGFETITYDYDAFGCGPHSHYKIKNFVDYRGNIKLIEKIKIYEDPKEDGLCVD